MRRVLVVVIALLAAMLLSGTTSALAKSSKAPPPTLTGETFSPEIGGVTDLTALCIPTVPVPVMTYSAAGPATGPYAGTFVESGTFTFTNGIPTVSASFTITTPTATVTGTKSGPASQFNCSNHEAQAQNISYTATIQRAGEKHVVWQDSGTSSLQVSSDFLETFTSTETTTIPIRHK